MSDNFLSQDDVDALFKSEVGEVADTDNTTPLEPQDGVRTYNLASQEHILRGRMPTLEILHEKFATQLRIGLVNYLHKSVETAAGPVKIMKYNEFIRSLVVPTNLNLVQIKPFRGTALVVIEPSLMFNFVDHLFGGNGRLHTRVEGREFTQTEQNIIQRVLNIVHANYEKSWEPVHPIEFEYIRSEMNTKFANITAPDEIVVTTAFNVDLGTGAGKIHICIPFTMIEPVRDLLSTNMKGDPPKMDEQWNRVLTERLETTEVEIRVDLGTCQLTLKDLVRMKNGDILPLTIPPMLQAKVDGIPVLECTYGMSHGNYALKVEQLLTMSNEDNAERTAKQIPEKTAEAA